MMNVVAVMGRIVATPELRKTPNGVSTTTFTIACERSYVSPGAERETDFIDIVAWRKSAEFACKYYSKGQLVAVNGSLQTRIYDDKEGVRHKVYEVKADNLHFADSKSSSGGNYNKNSEQMYGNEDEFVEIDDSTDLPF